MNYEEAIEYIESLMPTVLKPGLERFQLFMKEHACLQDQVQSIHVAGTNGKGSVISILAETLKEAGLKTGRYTGPHLLSYNERIAVNDKIISNDEFAALVSDLKEKSEDFGKRHSQHGILSWFELLTAMAFFHFSQSKVEAATYEVGLGGRWDATNVLSAPIASAIVSISLDHTHILGATESQIAAEKAGIIKSAVPLITACKGIALATIVAQAKEKNAAVIVVDENCNLSCGSGNPREFQYVDALKKRFESTSIPITNSIMKKHGYQRANACVAAAILGIWEIETGKPCLEHFDKSLSAFFWPGRLQYFEQHNLLLDGAHNQAGAKALKESLDELFPNKSRCFVLSFYRSKEFKEILSAILRPGDLVFASQSPGTRPVVPSEEIVMSAIELGAEAKAFPSLEEALKAALAQTNGSFIRIACGSFATVKAALKFMSYKTPEDSRRDSTVY